MKDVEDRKSRDDKELYEKNECLRDQKYDGLYELSILCGTVTKHMARLNKRGNM